MSFIPVHKPSKNSCIHLRLEDSQTRRHPALLSPLPACVEQSVRSDRLPPILLNDPKSSPEPHKSKSNYLSPPPNPPFHAGGEPQRFPVRSRVPTAQRRTADARKLTLLSAYRLVSSPVISPGLSPCYAPFHSALSQVKSDQWEGKIDSPKNVKGMDRIM